MNGNRNQTAIRSGARRFGPMPVSLQVTIVEHVRLYYAKCLQKESNLQPCGNECPTGAVEPGQHGHKLLENQVSGSEHRTKTQPKSATKPQLRWAW